jgi:hypothetical protein
MRRWMICVPWYALPACGLPRKMRDTLQFLPE